MAEDPQPLTLQQRIAALNAAHIGHIPGDPPRPSRPTPPVPTKRPVFLKQQTVNNPPERVIGSVTDHKTGNQPAPPPPPPAKRQPPPLPNRKNALDEQRRGSAASIAPSGPITFHVTKVPATRTKSTDSTNRAKAPAWGECELPALPPKSTHSQMTATGRTSDDRLRYSDRTLSNTVVIPSSGIPNVKPSPPARPSLPPRLPSRKHEVEHHEHAENAHFRQIPPLPSTESVEQAQKSTVSHTPAKEHVRPDIVPVPVGLPRPAKPHIPLPVREHKTYPAQETPALLSRENLPPSVRDVFPPSTQDQSSPPPIPLSSPPDLSAIQATKPRSIASTSLPNTTASLQTTRCLICRDFSGPDHQATLFPRTQVTSLQTLAQQLTSPFQSPTDKARAIFTWLHHNIAYDVVSFFGNNVKGSTPQSTLQSGLAVCEGYAALFTNLATYAGLESMVISGHGKGYGFAPLAPGSPLPAYNAGHAWNAVKIDNGEWKLIDCCWGAGYVQGAGRPYVKKLSPECFTMPNEEFATKHFPGNKDLFFLPGGRQMSWEEYIVINPAWWPDSVEGPTIFTNAKEDYSIGEKTVHPRARKINVRQQGLVRFQFGLLCPHWTLDKHANKGPPPVFIVSVSGADGRNKDHIPMDHHPGMAGQGGDMWIVDIPAGELGAPGQTLTLFAVTSFGDRQDARGLTVREFRDGKGRVGMGFVGIAAWDLV
ncbi:hypothetical protein A1O1_00936 [Capronia coronata CBS 617.96]|uniref:Transglutaminase-like domain-containing protein n=1 Tax=Capronia coronata CBS 617.96 TaxID=1182541 RepID=W9YSD1_9EURO|nr:uncharacterized protein A1O1_00936 [Capronia coronata CBS 617.96]EXJ95812.1 hypothetical protein A1O1_00936 [Capronia coronata CBS 617.96]